MTTVAAEFNYDIFYICCKLFQLSTAKPIATQLASLISKVLIPMTIPPASVSQLIVYLWRAIMDARARCS